MDILISLIQILFALLICGAALLFLFQLLLAWSWAQNTNDSMKLSEVLSTAAIEWASLIFACACMAKTIRTFSESPPLHGHAETLKQLPIVFVPSLHSGTGLFRILTWRLKSHYFLSLWPFYWKSFLVSEELLEDNLESYLERVLKETQAPNFRIISFGSSRPIVSKLLSRREDLKKKCDRWITVSSSKSLTSAMRFLKTKRLVAAYESGEQKVDPDISIYGTHDTLAYPASVFQGERMHAISPMGHYSTLFHSSTIQIIFRELS